MGAAYFAVSVASTCSTCAFAGAIATLAWQADRRRIALLCVLFVAATATSMILVGLTASALVSFLSTLLWAVALVGTLVSIIAGQVRYRRRLDAGDIPPPPAAAAMLMVFATGRHLAPPPGWTSFDTSGGTVLTDRTADEVAREATTGYLDHPRRRRPPNG